MEIAQLVWKIVQWAGEMALAFVAGDQGPEPARLAAILPDELRADLEHARQRKLLEDEVRAGEATPADG